MGARLLILFAICSGWAASLHAQQIKIVVLDARHGKPVTDECLNVSLGPWGQVPGSLLVPTDKHGIATLDFENRQVSASSVVGNTCNNSAATKPITVPSVPTSISIVTDIYVSCQYSKELTKSPDWLRASPAERIPSFSVQEIIASGVVAANSCSRLKPMPKPGELLLIVRKRTFWEGMRS